MIGRVLRRCGRLGAVGGGRARLTLIDLAGDARGAVAVILIITLSAIFLLVAVAIDVARRHTEVVRAQNARAGCPGRLARAWSS